ncbi:MAG: hypothetical protein ONB05_06195 [candidate division KSB1 bacterium]|nr:hypothetical protein [candidate division KSB1 bacterium]
MKVSNLVLTGIFILVIYAVLFAEEPGRIEEVRKDVEKLKTELNVIKSEYENRIAELTEKLNKLEKARAEEEQKAELEKLLTAAQEFTQREKEEEATIARVFRGGERQQQALNPEISLTGDFFGSYSNARIDQILKPNEFTDGRNCFFLREAEFHIVAPLDPFTRGKFFLGVPGDGHLHVGEAYMEWLNLPANMNLKIGKFRTQFGLLNRWHEHGLPQIDRPRAITNLFGLEGLAGMGVSMNFLLPKLWAHVNEWDVELITGGDGVSFAEEYDNLVLISHLKNYYDLTRNTYLEVGVSAAHGFNDPKQQHRTTLGAVDVTYKWVPAEKSRYRTLEFRNEFFWSHRETAHSGLNRVGFYSYLSNKMGARWWLGLRFSYSEWPRELEKKYDWDLSPYLDFWQSEWVMMRLQYSYTYRNYAEKDHSVFLQAVWSMGPHKHEAY